MGCKPLMWGRLKTKARRGTKADPERLGLEGSGVSQHCREPLPAGILSLGAGRKLGEPSFQGVAVRGLLHVGVCRGPGTQLTQLCPPPRGPQDAHSLPRAPGWGASRGGVRALPGSQRSCLVGPLQAHFSGTESQMAQLPTSPTATWVGQRLLSLGKPSGLFVHRPIG